LQNLIGELIKIHDVNIVKLKSHDACLYMKSIVLFLFELKHCINHMYFKLFQIMPENALHWYNVLIRTRKVRLTSCTSRHRVILILQYLRHVF